MCWAAGRARLASVRARVPAQVLIPVVNLLEVHRLEKPVIRNKAHSSVLLTRRE